jgi:putative ABC transport system permease protein
MRLLHLTALVRARLGLDPTDRELDEEIQHHLALETERQLRDGHDLATARKRALARFGDPRRVAEATRDERGTSWLAGTIDDLRWGGRVLRRHVAFSALALTTLAIGIGTTTVAFAALDTVLLRPLGFVETERLVVIKEQTAEKSVLPPSYPNFADWRDRARSFSGVVSELLPFGQTAFVGADPLRVTTMGVSRGFFATLGVRPAIGREFTAEENAPGGPAVAMVSHQFWVDQLGRRATLGFLRLGGRSVDVIGVLPASLRLVGDQADIFVPHEQNPSTGRTSYNYAVIARLAPGATIESARIEMTALSQALIAEYGNATKAVDVVITPLRDSIIGVDDRRIIVITFVAAALVLLITCANLVSAQLARGLGRAREFGVRAALGASRGRLVRQLLAESAMVSAVGALLGLGVTVVLTRIVRTAGTPVVPRLGELVVNHRVLAFALAVSLLTVMLIGLYPALRFAAGDVGDSIRGASRNPGGGTRSRAWPLLVGFEVALAMVLVVGSALLVRTMRNITTSDFGVDPRGIVTAVLTGGTPLTPPEIERVRGDLASVPGVVGAAVVTRSPLVWWNQSGPVWRPADPAERWPVTAGFRVISPEYFTVMRQRVIEGRRFTSADDSGGVGVAIVTAGLAARLWPGESAVGKIIRTSYLGDQWLTVAGVVAEASHWDMKRGEQHEIFVPIAQQPNRARGQLVMMVRTDASVRALLPVVRTRLRELVPSRPVTLDTMSDQISRSSAGRRFAMMALLTFGTIALGLAGLGIYGVVSYSVRAREHEIGVRMALGATPRAVQLHVLKSVGAMTVGGLVTGILGSLFATSYLASLLYEVSRFDAKAYWGATIFLAVTVVLGAFLPARRSSRVDPLVAIRGP